VIVLLTDGQVGDESTVLRSIQDELGDARVFTVGIDTAVNHGFLTRLAALGGGTSSFVEPGADLEDALGAVGREIGTPLITDLKIEGEVGQLTPARVPDLFAGRASSVLFRGTGKVTVTGKLPDGSRFSETVEPREAPLSAVAHLWARSRITDLEDSFRAAPSDELRRELIALSKKHLVLSRFTAFVATDGEVVVRDQARRTVVQPVANPAQWTMGSLGGMPAATGATRMMARPGGPMAKASLERGRPSAIYEMSQSVGAAPPSTTTSRRQSARIRPMPPELGRVQAAVETLVLAFEQARKDGKAEPLEQARKDLLDALNASFELAATVPLLQRFLRGALVELIAALKAGSPGDLFDRHAPALEAARAEVRGEKPSAGRFWEASI
jgi:Ca-activated chloride channel family protein